MRPGETRHRQAIDQAGSRLDSQTMNGIRHRLVGGFKDVNAVNLSGLYHRGKPVQRLSSGQSFKPLGPTAGRKAFGVVETLA